MTSYLSMVPVHVLFSGRHGMPPPNRAGRPRELHGSVMRLFGPVGSDSPRAAAGVLFRLEPAGPSQPPRLLVRSSVAPESIVEEMLVREEQDAPAAGTPVAFRVAVNAVRRQKGGGIRPVPRDDAPQEGFDGMTEWVSERMRGALLDVELLNHDRTVIGGGTEMPLQVDLVDGFGVIEDSAALAALLSAGVGRAKNYGCGLLTVKPVA